MMGLEGRLKARREAPLHLQVELVPFSAQPFALDREVSIGGHVVEIFRGQGLANPGDHLSFELWVCHSQDGPTGPPFVHYKHLIEATHLEAYLYGSPPSCHLAAHEFRLLRERSTTPTMGVEELEVLLSTTEVANGVRVPASRWWKFWRR